MFSDDEEFNRDIIKFCLNKKYERDKEIYDKPRSTFFDDDELLNYWKIKMFLDYKKEWENDNQNDDDDF
jgi:hypothetical protein